jgi:aldehyde dehydrogenase (NAD+)/betaine-aldehyde dehydrogenase
VPVEIYDEAAAAAVAVLQGLHVGDPHDDATDVGPLITDEHRSRVLNEINVATAAGAVILQGGKAVPGGGYFMQPTLIGGLSNDDELAQHELFAPVGVILPYDDVEHAVVLANATRYGLNANIWGPTPDALAVARLLRVGNATINGGGDVRPQSPWGGYKRSGVGREMGEEGFSEYFQTKHVQWRVR